MQLILQPCGDSDAIEHYVDTVENPVALSRILPFLTPSEGEAVRRTFSDAVAVWGVTPGKTGGNASKWQRIELGDTALLYRNRRFFFKGTVAFKVHSADLARELWQTRADGVTWEYAFFLTDLEPVDIPVERFNAAVGYKLNNIIQGFNVLPPDSSERVLDQLDLGLSVGAVLPTPDQLERARARLAELSDDMDLAARSSRRAEQQYLRTILLGGRRTSPCAICSRELPVDLIVTGHIRRRHSCSPEQRRDLANVMPICVLGCDALFENGYITVGEDGRVRAEPTALAHDHLASVAKAVDGLECRAWGADSAPYFAWHRAGARRFV
jgi:hypothetical protein